MREIVFNVNVRVRVEVPDELINVLRELLHGGGEVFDWRDMSGVEAHREWEKAREKKEKEKQKQKQRQGQERRRGKQLEEKDKDKEKRREDEAPEWLG